MRGFLTRLRFKLPAPWRRFGDAREGVAAVEFAMILPLMLTMWLGTVEVGQAISINRKSSQVSRTLADLSARATAITNAEMNNIFAATTAVLAPYDPARLGMTVASIKLVAVGQARVIWSESRGLNPPSIPVNSTVTLPAGLLTELNRTIIIGETNYQYMPTVGWIVSKSGFNVNEKTYMVPRQVPEVTRIP